MEKNTKRNSMKRHYLGAENVDARHSTRTAKHKTKEEVKACREEKMEEQSNVARGVEDKDEKSFSF